MRIRLGLALAHDSIRAVLVKAGAVVWAREVILDDPAKLSEEITKLLRAVPVTRGFRPRVTAAIGPSLSQVRRVGGLPHLTDSKALAQIIREGVSRFFLHGEARLLTSRIRIVEPGTVWAAAIDESTARTVIIGCAAAGFRVRAIVPAAVVIGAGLEGDELHWPDGPVALKVTLEGRKLMSVRRTTQPAPNDYAEPRPGPALAFAKDRCWRFADAYGAALLAEDEVLAVRPNKINTGAPDVPRWRIMVASVALAVACAGAASARGFVASRARNDADNTLATIGNQYRNALATRADLKRIAEVLEQVSTIEAKRTSATLLIGALARGLPERAALTAIRLDSVAGTIVALTPSAADVMIALDKGAEITDPELVGPITRELVAGEQFERATIRFRFGPAKKAPPFTDQASP